MTRPSNAIYYLIMAIFFAVVGSQWYVQNTITEGNISTLYQFGSYAAYALAVVSVLSIFLEKDGFDVTEADIEIPFINLTFPKWLYYILAILIMAGQFYSAVMLNRNSTGWMSTLSYLWTPVSGLLLLATFGNCRSYMRKRALVVVNRARLAAQQARENQLAY